MSWWKGSWLVGRSIPIFDSRVKGFYRLDDVFAPGVCLPPGMVEPRTEQMNGPLGKRAMGVEQLCLELSNGPLEICRVEEIELIGKISLDPNADVWMSQDPLERSLWEIVMLMNGTAGACL